MARWRLPRISIATVLLSTWYRVHTNFFSRFRKFSRSSVYRARSVSPYMYIRFPASTTASTTLYIIQITINIPTCFRKFRITPGNETALYRQCHRCVYQSFQRDLLLNRKLHTGRARISFMILEVLPCSSPSFLTLLFSFRNLCFSLFCNFSIHDRTARYRAYINRSSLSYIILYWAKYIACVCEPLFARSVPQGGKTRRHSFAAAIDGAWQDPRGSPAVQLRT